MTSQFIVSLSNLVFFPKYNIEFFQNLFVFFYIYIYIRTHGDGITRDKKKGEGRGHDHQDFNKFLVRVY